MGCTQDEVALFSAPGGPASECGHQRPLDSFGDANHTPEHLDQALHSLYLSGWPGVLQMADKRMWTSPKLSDKSETVIERDRKRRPQ